MNHKLKSYILLTRLNRPIGSLLLMFPCLWGLIAACNSIPDIKQNTFLFIIFIIGSFVMRSAGCVINDIFVGLFTKGVDGSSIKGSVKN